MLERKGSAFTARELDDRKVDRPPDSLEEPGRVDLGSSIGNVNHGLIAGGRITISQQGNEEVAKILDEEDSERNITPQKKEKEPTKIEGKSDE